MSGELILGCWLIFCAALGTTRTVLKYRRDPTGWLWVAEGVGSVFAFGVGAIFAVHALAINLLG
jgi:hypothetical protein